ncbi:HYR domain-containing protein [Maribellus luteus]|uniref:HYR domain-containing protein n=1 Tax=Maribellus luteus TaxID=2305463 RepID=A0A399SVL4_9BACT|nr:HYR domain-containing protein [Maribellus luteus]RIJ46829.1 HYR domain-containing protein [Maribellus luteus]
MKKKSLLLLIIFIIGFSDIFSQTAQILDIGIVNHPVTPDMAEVLDQKNLKSASVSSCENEKGYSDFPFTIDGLTVTGSGTGTYTRYYGSYTDCGVSTKANSVYIGSSGPATFTNTFSTPVNDMVYNITAADNGEIVTITVDNGTPEIIIDECSCPENIQISGNVITLGIPSAVVGVRIIVRSTSDYSSISFSHNGGNAGLLMTMCFDAVIESIQSDVSTSSVSSITNSSAVCGGNIISDGGSYITAKGVCWSTSTNPSILDSKTEDGSGIETFVSTITGLSRNTTYYVKAYATNSVGTGYGDEVSFTTLLNYSGGSGTIANPYQIARLEDLKYLSEHPEDWDAYFIQVADIDASATSSWNGGKGFDPIGWIVSFPSNNDPFTGFYDGNEKTINNLYINRPGEGSVGLFGYINGATVRNLGMNNANITGSGNTGTLFGTVYTGSHVEGCWVTGTVKGNNTAGGFAGNNYKGTILDCYARVNVINDFGTSYVGGFIAFLNGTLTNVYAAGQVSGANANGLVGNFAGGPITSSYWDTQASGVSISTAGTGRTTEEMQIQDTYSGWNFSSTWSIDPLKNDGYPYLSWQSFVMLTTSSVTAIESNSATGGGEITDDDGNTFSAIGLCWNTSGMPTILDNKTTNGSVSAPFSGSITGLEAKKKYFVRAYATTSGGVTYYGNEESFTTANGVPVANDFTASPGPYQNVVYSFYTSDFGYADGESDPLNHIRIVAIPSSGRLYVDGAVTENDAFDVGEELANGAMISKADLDAGNLQYYTTVATNTSFKFAVNDGIDYSASTYDATLNTIPAVKVSITTQTNVSCNGENDGSLTATVTPGAPNYSYVWSNGSSTFNSSATTNTISSLNAGAYSVIVTDLGGNKDTASAIITQPAKLVASVVADSMASCYGESDGGMTASVIGGTSPYSYLWSNGAKTTSVSGVAAGTYNVTVTDFQGCESTASIEIVVIDTFAPVAGCKDINVFLDTDGSVALNSLAIENGSTDNCGIFSHTLDINSFNCGDIGENIVTMTVSDFHSNSASCQSVVTVLDTISPAVQTKDITVYLDESGFASIDSSDVDAGSTDNCGIKTISISQNTFDCSDIDATSVPTSVGLKSSMLDAGSNGVLVQLTVEDNNNNVGSEWFVVTVLDTISPVTEHDNITVEADADRCGTNVYYDVIRFSADFAQREVSTSCEDWEAFRADLSSSYTYKSVTIKGSMDSIGVSITDPDKVAQIADALRTGSYISVDFEGRQWRVGLCGNGIELSAAGSTCMCEDDEYIIRPCIGNSNWGGAGTATCNGPSQTIIVEFEIAQGFSDQDNCDVEVNYIPESGSFLPVGETTVVKTVTDKSGNSSTTEFTVLVEDKTLPIVLARDTTLYLDANGIASLMASSVGKGSFDECGIDTMYLSKNSFDCGDLGTQNVTLTVVDIDGNQALSLAQVTVLDTISPVVACQPITVYLDETGFASIAEDSVDNGSADACVFTFDTDTTAFGCSDVFETNIVTLTVTDASGNWSSCTSAVTVLDTISPIAICQPITVYLDAAGFASIAEDSVDNGSADACAYTFDTDITEFGCSDVLETNIVTMKVTDASGNWSSCTSEVTVLDTIQPTVICRDTTLHVGETGIAIIDFSSLDNGSSDACGIASMSLSKTEFTGEDVGANLVELSATDVYGNVSSCVSTVTVMDTIAPVVSCKDIGLNLGENGSSRLYALYILDSAFDAGGIVSHDLSKSKFNCSNVGNNIVELTVTDVGGNTATCSANVEVYDNFAPVVFCNDLEVYLDENGIAEVEVPMLEESSDDACGIAQKEISQSIFTDANLGDNTVNLYVIDVNGNVGTCESKVTVNDTIAPVVACNPISIWLSAGKTYQLTVDDITALAAGSFDNATTFENLIVDVVPGIFECKNIGDSIPVTVSVTDKAGNQSSCETKVFVSYSADKNLEDIHVELPAGVCETTVDYPAIFTGESCATLTLLDGLGAGGVFPVGTTVETWEVALEGAKDTVSFSVTVNSANAVPTLDPVAGVTASEDQQVVISLTGISDGGDCIAQELSISAATDNTDLIENMAVAYTSNESTAELELSLATNKTGEAQVVVRVTDEEGAFVTDTFMVFVQAGNHAPVLIIPVADQEVEEGAVLNLALSKVPGEMFTDPDGDELVWSFTVENDTVPAWMKVTETAGEFVFDFTPQTADTGCYNIIVAVEDPAGATATDTFELCVLRTITGIGDINEGLFAITMYPNPTTGKVYVGNESQSNENIAIIVFSASGSEVLRKEFRASDRIQFDLSDQVAGFYLVSIKQGEQQVVKKLIFDRK